MPFSLKLRKFRERIRDGLSKGKRRSNNSDPVKGKAPATHARRSKVYTMEALETALKTDPTPLLRFAATKDFTAESISYLLHVNEWREKWSRLPEFKNDEPQALRQRQFNHAVEIYSSFISNDSKFTINLEGPLQGELAAILGPAASTVNVKTKNDKNNAVVPFAPWDTDTSASLSTQPVSSDGRETDDSALEEYMPATLFRLKNRLAGDVPTPEAFNESIFDKSEISIKELVLTNTWARFVKAKGLDG